MIRNTRNLAIYENTIFEDTGIRVEGGCWDASAVMQLPGVLGSPDHNGGTVVDASGGQRVSMTVGCALERGNR